MINGNYISDYEIPPGEYLEEVIESLGMSKGELANRIDRPPSKLSQIFNGSKAITEETALRLEKAVGVASDVWLGLQRRYDSAKWINKESAIIAKDKKERKRYFNIYRSLQDVGEEEATDAREDKIKAVWWFLGVTNLANVKNIQQYQPAFRIADSKKDKADADKLIVFIRLLERAAQHAERDYDEAALKNRLPELRGLTRHKPATFLPKIKDALAEAGVSFVTVPKITGAYISGAMVRLHGNKRVAIGLTDKGKRADVFWFNLFHEIGHALLHKKERAILETGDNDEKQEREADEFAAGLLIPRERYHEFLATRSGPLSKAKVLRFAKELGVHPGIVVGRLQKDGKLPATHLKGLLDEIEFPKLVAREE
jgi:HTH-type transcriptional regulator / antitoxin HigA